MLNIYLSDQVLADLKHYVNNAPHCLNALKIAIARFTSIHHLLKETRIPKNHDIK